MTFASLLYGPFDERSPGTGQKYRGSHKEGEKTKFPWDDKSKGYKGAPAFSADLDEGNMLGSTRKRSRREIRDLGSFPPPRVLDPAPQHRPGRPKSKLVEPYLLIGFL
jgi:hypothetical protein